MDVDVNMFALLSHLVLRIVNILVRDLFEVVLFILDGWVVVNSLVLEDRLAYFNWSEIATNNLSGVFSLLKNLNVDVDFMLLNNKNLGMLSDIESFGDGASNNMLNWFLDDVIRNYNLLNVLINLEEFINIDWNSGFNNLLDVYLLLSLSVESDFKWLVDMSVGLFVSNFLNSLDDVNDNFLRFNNFFISIDNNRSVQKLLFVDHSVLKWLYDEVLAVEVKSESYLNMSMLGLEDFPMNWALDFLCDELLLDYDLLTDNLLWHVDNFLYKSFDNVLPWYLNNLLNLNSIFNVVRNWSADNFFNFNLLVDLVDSWYLFLDGNDFLTSV